jgi:hypothetical protein
MRKVLDDKPAIKFDQIFERDSAAVYCMKNNGAGVPRPIVLLIVIVKPTLSHEKREKEKNKQ